MEKQFQGFHLQDLVNVLRVELDPEVEPHEIAVLFHILASTDKHIFLGFSRPNMETLTIRSSSQNSKEDRNFTNAFLNRKSKHRSGTLSKLDNFTAQTNDMPALQFS